MDANDNSAETELRVSKLIGGGRGLAHADDATWMVRGGLPGELLRVRPARRRARIIEADVVEVLDDPHPARLPENCPHADRCGGCDWPQVDPLAGSALKITVAAEAAARFPEIEAWVRDATITDSPAAYRLRCRLHWDPPSQTLGFYGHRSWQVSPITHCRIVSSALASRLPGLSELLADSCPAPVDLEIVEGDDGVVAALRPARKGPKIVDARWVPPVTACRDLAGFHRLTRRSELLPGWGREAVIMNLPVKLEVPVGSFFQGNRHLVPWLFNRIADLIGSGDEPVFDLHGGVGFLGAAGRSAGRNDINVVEPHRPAAMAARRNLPDSHGFVGSAEDFVDGCDNLPSAAVVITDPPRSGLTPTLRRQIAAWRPDRLLMLGCDPATWARDTAELLGVGYRLAHIELVDLFPFTHHVEVLAVLEAE